MADNVKYIIPTINIYSELDSNLKSTKQFDDVSNAYCRIIDFESKKTFCKQSLSDNKDGVSNGNIVCVITKIHDHWSFQALGYYTEDTRHSKKMVPIIQEILSNNLG